MSRYAIVKDGEVVNVVEWDGQRSNPVPEDAQAVEIVLEAEAAGIGRGYSKGEFIDIRPVNKAELPPVVPTASNLLGAILDPEVKDLDGLWQRIAATVEDREASRTL